MMVLFVADTKHDANIDLNKEVEMPTIRKSNHSKVET